MTTSAPALPLVDRLEMRIKHLRRLVRDCTPRSATLHHTQLTSIADDLEEALAELRRIRQAGAVRRVSGPSVLTPGPGTE